ncbi:MAG: hypothetical protein U9R00_01475 [Patescibacteria group bacterium]|nr:hypothetical protein [Patescibacteria group bacterium]
MNPETRTCQNCKKDFVIEPEDFDFYKKIDVPAPTFCPDCRLARKLTWRNERTLFKRACDFCGKDIISMHKPDSIFPVYCHDCWWSDKWDPLDYGQDYDFNKSFFNQFNELQEKTPRPSAYSTANINSEYCNHSAHMKNSYLIFGSWFSEDCGYGQTVMDSKNCWDCIFIRKCESCFQSTDLTECNQVFFSKQCHSCIDSFFIFDCRNCQNCIFSFNLRNKKYHIFNKPVSKEEYKKIKEEIFSSRTSLEEAKRKFKNLIKKEAFHKFMIGDRNNNVSGEFIFNSKNVHKSYYIDNGENEKYVVRGGVGQKDTMDGFGTHSGELCYETNNIDFSSRCLFSLNGESNINSSYLIDCDHVNNSFGCISVQKDEYCILNKKYSKEEYNELIPKIIKSMGKNLHKDKRGVTYGYGEFFPGEISPFFYNETIAQEWFPLDKEKATALGYRWKDDNNKKSYVPTVSSKDLPEKIKEIDESIFSEIILCESWDEDKKEAQKHGCTKAFKVIQNELSFYRKYNIPLPVRCSNCRYFKMFSERNLLGSWHRTCMKEGCNNEFETSYSPDREEIVYCESCYKKEVY